MSASALIPSLDSGFQKYMSDIKAYPVLTIEEENSLAEALVNHQSKEAAHKLITSHLRLVVAIAFKYKGYGLPIIDLVAEGNIGLMQAVKKLDHRK